MIKRQTGPVPDSIWMDVYLDIYLWSLPAGSPRSSAAAVTPCELQPLDVHMRSRALQSKKLAATVAIPSKKVWPWMHGTFTETLLPFFENTCITKGITGMTLWIHCSEKTVHLVLKCKGLEILIIIVCPEGLHCKQIHPWTTLQNQTSNAWVANCKMVNKILWL